MTPGQIRALEVVMDYVERWNKNDEDIVAADALGILQNYLDKHK